MKHRTAVSIACLLLAMLAALSPLLIVGPAASAAGAAYQAASPEYGISMFLYGNRATTQRDLELARALGFGWQKSLFRWRDLEGACKGCYTWDEADRIVQASAQAGLQIIARLDFQPGWARADGANNGAPDNAQDFADFVGAFVERYRAGSPHGTVAAIEVWNEVNLLREWGSPISPQAAADYVRLLERAYQAAKAADPSVTVVTAGLSPTGWTDHTAQPDDEYLQWLFAAGLKAGVNYDVLGAHANTQCPSVEAEFGACPVLAERMGHPSFYFRRVEQLRAIQEAHGDGAAQIWLLEFGWTTDPVNPAYAWYATTEERKASLFVEAFHYAATRWAPWIGVMTVWTLADPRWGPSDEQVYWAITNPDGSPRPAYARLLQASQQGQLPALGAAPRPRNASTTPTPSSGRRAAATPTPKPASSGGPVGDIRPPSLPPLESETQKLRVIDSGVNLRSGPSVDALVVRVLEFGEEVTALGGVRQLEGRSWRNIRTADGQDGWVAEEFLAPA